MRPKHLELRPEPVGSRERGVSGGGACSQGQLAGGSLEQRACAVARGAWTEHGIRCELPFRRESQGGGGTQPQPHTRRRRPLTLLIILKPACRIFLANL